MSSQDLSNSSSTESSIVTLNQLISWSTKGYPHFINVRFSNWLILASQSVSIISNEICSPRWWELPSTWVLKSSTTRSTQAKQTSGASGLYSTKLCAVRLPGPPDPLLNYSKTSKINHWNSPTQSVPRYRTSSLDVYNMTRPKDSLGTTSTGTQPSKDTSRYTIHNWLQDFVKSSNMLEDKAKYLITDLR